jgi:hypothetical protein
MRPWRAIARIVLDGAGCVEAPDDEEDAPPSPPPQLPHPVVAIATAAPTSKMYVRDNVRSA